MEGEGESGQEVPPPSLPLIGGGMASRGWMLRLRPNHCVIPAKAGIPVYWIQTETPAFAGVTLCLTMRWNGCLPLQARVVPLIRRCELPTVVILGLDPRRLYFDAGSASAEPSAQGRG